MSDDVLTFTIEFRGEEETFEAPPDATFEDVVRCSRILSDYFYDFFVRENGKKVYFEMETCVKDVVTVQGQRIGATPYARSQ